MEENTQYEQLTIEGFFDEDPIEDNRKTTE